MSADEREDLAEGSLISHLVELRDRLLRAVIAIGVIFVPCAFFANDLFTLVATPLIEKMPKGTSMIATSLVSPFLAPLKLSLFVALFIAMPYVLYQAWAFVAPGLYRREKHFAVPLLVSSVILFYAGAVFAYQRDQKRAKTLPTASGQGGNGGVSPWKMALRTRR